MAKRALVTGGAGLIGSHVTDLLVREGWKVRCLDNLEPQTHRRGRPAWINEKPEFVYADLLDCDMIATALDKIDVFLHMHLYAPLIPLFLLLLIFNLMRTVHLFHVCFAKS